MRHYVIQTGEKGNRDEQTARQLYLESLRTNCNLLPLSALADDRDPHRGAAMSLSQVYIDLNTTTPREKLPRGAKRRARPEERDEEQPPLTALEVAIQNPALILLGDPGSGKSSFTNHLLYLCVGYLLDKKKNPMPPGWPAKRIVPVRILLRDLAIDLQNAEAGEWLALSDDIRDRRLISVIDAYLEKQLHEIKASAFVSALHATMMAGDCLVVLDGLDEVAVDQRELMRAAIQALRYRKGPNRYIVTCRIRSWDPKHSLPAFHVSTLAPFTNEQVEQFIQHWYGALQESGQFSKAQATARVASMQNAIGALERDLVQNPLLLTTMAVVHYNDTELPRERVKLYKRAAEVMLKRWQMHRAGRTGVYEAMGIGDRELYDALRELAFMAHRSGKAKDAADISRDKAREILERHFAALEKPWDKAVAFLEYVDQTAGLLVGRGGINTIAYAFPHRTFQEYFAGTYLAKSRRGFERELLDKLAEGDYWQLAAQLGLEDLLHNAQMSPLALNAAYALCPVEPIDLKDEAKWRGILWSANFALEIGQEKIKSDTVSVGGQRYLDRLIRNLVTLIEKGLLSARERADAGFVLGKLGDPREGVCTLPPIWVELPGGRFVMGDNKGEDDEKPPHEVELSPFEISKYPITNAQFAEFVNAGGYQEKKWWSKEGWEYRKNKDWERPRYWDDDDLNLPNQPVVGVSWFEAEAFCAWFTEQVANSKKQTATGKREIVRLPTEVEWEFAARGLQSRKFPWGDDEPTPEHANYGELINRTTAVGAYPQGASPEGILDLAGNVWEWCLDWYGDKYYAECKKRGVVKDPSGPKKGEWRVFRGGAYWNDANDLRAARRVRRDPDYRGYYWCFRVVVSAGS